MTYTITYNWHEKSLKAIPEEFRHNSLIYDRELVQQLCTQNQVIIQESDVSGNPELAELLKATDCRQMLLLPLFESGLTPGHRKKSNACKICPRLSLYNWIIINL